MPSKNRRIFEHALNIVSEFMSGKKDNMYEYESRFLKYIDAFYTMSTDEAKAKKILDGNIGRCMQHDIHKTIKPIKKLRGKLNIVGKYHGERMSTIALDDTFNDNYLYNLKVLIHELTHADTLTHSELVGNTRYNGLKKVKDGKAKGKYIDEAMTEFYTQIMMYEKYPKIYKNINSIEDILYKLDNPKYNDNFFGGNSKYSDIMLFVKLLLIACDNNITNKYESLTNKEEPFVERKIYLDNGQVSLKNDLLYVGKYDLRLFESKFDEIVGEEGKFEELLVNLDNIYADIESKKGSKYKFKEIDKKPVIEFIKTLDNYRKAKELIFHENGYWNNTNSHINEFYYRDYKLRLCIMCGINPSDLENRKKLTL